MKCVKCDVEGQVIDVGTASGRKSYRCPGCGTTWREKNAAAVALGSLGGRARAQILTPERRVEIAKYARSIALDYTQKKELGRLSTDERNILNVALRKEREYISKIKGSHSNVEWLRLLRFCGEKCLRCGGTVVKLQKDHIIPVYQGGSDLIDNLQPLCKRCNAAKGPEVVDYRPDGWQKVLSLETT